MLARWLGVDSVIFLQSCLFPAHLLRAPVCVCHEEPDSHHHGHALVDHALGSERQLEGVRYLVHGGFSACTDSIQDIS